MRVSQGTGSCDVRYERFSANNGVCYIKMDKFNELGRIITLTQEYLASPGIQQALQILAEDIAKDYLEAHSTVHSANLTVPDRRSSHAPGPTSPQSQASTFQLSRSSPPNTTPQPGASLPTADSNISQSTTTTDASAEPVGTVPGQKFEYTCRIPRSEHQHINISVCQPSALYVALTRLRIYMI